MKPFQQWTFLFIVYMLYLLIGGGIFMALEQQHEKNEKETLQRDINEILLQNKLGVNESSRHENGDSAYIRLYAIAGIVNRFSAVCTRASDRVVEFQADDLVPTANSNLKWNFYNAVYFAFSCTTTIGYGHLSPQTSWGKIFTIIFALVGIPINGTLVYGLGDYFGSKLITLHNRFKKLSGRLALVFDITFYVIPGITFFLIIPAGLLVITENWSFLEAFYYAFTSLTTIGFGDYVAGIGGDQNSVWLWLDKVIIILWITFGLGYLVMILGFITKGIKSKKLLIAIEKRLDSIHLTKEKLVKDVEYMTSLVNDLYIWQCQQPICDGDDYIGEYTKTKDHQASPYNKTRRYSLSTPNLMGDCSYKEDLKQSIRKRVLSRTKSESVIFDAVYRHKSENSELLVSVVTALSRKISTQVLSAVETLNKYEAEVLAQKAKGIQSRRKNDGINHTNAPRVPESNRMETNPQITVTVIPPTADLEQVVVHDDNKIPSSGEERKKYSGVATVDGPSISKYDVARKQSFFEAQSRNEQFGYKARSDYLNASYCRNCGDLRDKIYRPETLAVPSHDEIDGSGHLLTYSNNLQKPPIRLKKTSAPKNRISITEEGDVGSDQPRRRKVTAEQNSLQNFLKVLDSVHEKLNTEVENPDFDEQSASTTVVKRKERKRKNGLGFFNPGHSSFSYTRP